MSTRNKKGKLHSIFKSQFQLTFFHKPSMESDDIYYYIVLEDILLLKAKFVQNTVLVVEELRPLTTAYLEKEYERLFHFFKKQTSITVLVSLLGNIGNFRQTCLRFDAPVIEDERFLSCSQTFYQKFKNYCGNNVEQFGFFLLALSEDDDGVGEPETQETEMEPSNDVPKDTMDTVKETVVDALDVEENPTPKEPNHSFEELRVFLEKWKSLYLLSVVSGGSSNLQLLTKHTIGDPDFQLVLTSNTSYIEILFSYNKTDHGHCLTIHKIAIHKDTGIFALIQLVKTLIQVVDDYWNKTICWDIYILVTQDTPLYQLLSDLNFQKVYRSGNCLTVKTDSGYRYEDTIATMVYTKRLSPYNNHKK